MTKREIIEETKEYYSSDPSRRAYDEKYGGCRYLTADGRQCAVGRCFMPNAEIVRDEYYRVDVSVSQLDAGGSADKIKNLEEILKPEYRGHEPEFWLNLQVFHDLNKVWCSSGLTEKGEEYYQNLLKKWGE
jgi:hypothetical protein